MVVAHRLGSPVGQIAKGRAPIGRFCYFLTDFSSKRSPLTV